MPDTNPLLSAANLSVGAGPATLLSGINLRIAPGDLIVLLGPNGSGKSTLLRTLAHLIPAYAGTLTLGEPNRPLAQSIAYVPQSIHFPEDYTVREAVRLGRLPHGFAFSESAADNEAITKALADTELTPLADRPLSALSGGEAQRVAIARALAQSTPLLILDEPTAHLDVRYQAELACLIAGLNQRDTAVLLAVHDVDWATQLPAQTWLLINRQLVQHPNAHAAWESGDLSRAYNCLFERVTDNQGHERLIPGRLMAPNQPVTPNN